MSVQVTCSSCGAMFAAQPHLYGQQVQCPSCGGALAIPNPDTGPSTSPPIEPPAPPETAVQPDSSGPLDDPLGSASFEQDAPMLGLPSQPAYRQMPPPDDAPMSDEDKRVIMKAVFGVGGILLLLAIAIVVTSLLSGGGGEEPAATAEVGNSETSEDDDADSGSPAKPSVEDTTTSKKTPPGKAKGSKSPAGASKSKSKPPAEDPPASETPPADPVPDVPDGPTFEEVSRNPEAYVGKEVAWYGEFANWTRTNDVERMTYLGNPEQRQTAAAARFFVVEYERGSLKPDIGDGITIGTIVKVGDHVLEIQRGGGAEDVIQKVPVLKPRAFKPSEGDN